MANMIMALNRIVYEQLWLVNMRSPSDVPYLYVSVPIFSVILRSSEEEDELTMS